MGRDNIHYAEAVGLLRKEQWDQAAVAFTAALKSCPTDTRARLGRSRCRVQLGHFDAALKDAEDVMEQERDEDERDTRRRHRASPAKAGGTPVDEGIQPVQRYQGLLQKASALYAAGDFERAIVCYHIGMRQRPDVAHFKAGVLKAEAAIQRCLPTQPRHLHSPSSRPSPHVAQPTPTKPSPYAAQPTPTRPSPSIAQPTLIFSSQRSTAGRVETMQEFREDVRLLQELRADPAFSNEQNLNNVFPNRWRSAACPPSSVSAPTKFPLKRLLHINNNNHPANLAMYYRCRRRKAKPAKEAKDRAKEGGNRREKGRESVIPTPHPPPLRTDSSTP
eukprot:Hpha_TRINITY_DN16283_c1_g3::TRINITY_DN16283_c1_g3_i1::g.16290::m.16290